jgi:heptosyltransferase I
VKLGRLASPESLLVVRLGAMGDILHTLPAVTALRAALPETRIGWVVEERWAELLCLQHADRWGPRNASRPVVDRVHIVNTKSWRRAPFRSSTRRELSLALAEIRGQKYQVAADFQGAIKSALIAKAARARIIVGMDTPRETLARLFYHQRVQSEAAHVIEQYHGLAEAIAGRELGKSAAQLPLDSTAEEGIARTIREWGGEFVILSPGAGWGAKQWPVERYAEVARAVSGDGFRVMVNVDPGEQELARVIETAAPNSVRRFSGSIGELIALTRRARLLVGGDSGPLHLAAALAIPVVAIFGPTDPARNGPYGTKQLVLRNPASQTSLSHTGRPDPGLLAIPAKEVILAVRRMLGKSDG